MKRRTHIGALLSYATLILCVPSAGRAQKTNAQKASAQKATASAPLSIGQTFTIKSSAVNETRRINVYLPAGYSDTASTRYPVMYMPDGGIAEDFLHVAGLFQVLQGNGTMRPFILVGIENIQRRRDLTGPTTNPEDRKIAKTVSGSAAFRRFIRTELMPVVKQRYRTTDETAVMGESLAGLFVVETFFEEPELFGTYVAFDPSLWWNNHVIVDNAKSKLDDRTRKPHTLYLSNSDEPVIAGLTAQFVEILKASDSKAVTWFYEPLPHETHATIYHPAALQALRRLFPPPPEKK